MGLHEKFRLGDSVDGPCEGPVEEGKDDQSQRGAAYPRRFSHQSCAVLSIFSLLLLLDIGHVEARQWYESRASANMSVAVYETFHQTGHNCVHDSHIVPRINEIHRRRHRGQEIK